MARAGSARINQGEEENRGLVGTAVTGVATEVRVGASVWRIQRKDWLWERWALGIWAQTGWGPPWSRDDPGWWKCRCREGEIAGGLSLVWSCSPLFVEVRGKDTGSEWRRGWCCGEAEGPTWGLTHLVGTGQEWIYRRSFQNGLARPEISLYAHSSGCKIVGKWGWKLANNRSYI